MSWMDKAETVEVSNDLTTDMRRIVPFHSTGMSGWQGYSSDEYIWYKFQTFEANMRFCHVTKGWSSVKFHFKDEDGIEYEMFMKNAPEFINNATRGCLEGRWGFVKRGANYGVQYLGE